MARRVNFILIVVLFLAAPATFAAKDCDIDMTSNATIVKSAKACGFNISNAGIGKKVPAPKKVAIAAFQIRFDFSSQRYGMVMQTAYGTIDNTQRNYLQFEDDVYQEITDNMYDMFVISLEALGFEVVPKEAVTNSEVYAMVKADESARKKKEMVRMTASGLKNIKGKGGATASIAAQQKLAGINEELGADATIAVFATMGLLSTKGKNAGVKVCLGSSHGGYSAGQDFELLVLAGTKTDHFPGGKPMYTPKARAQISFAVKKQMCYGGSVQERTNSKWAWKAKYSSDLDDYIDGTVRLFGWASTIAMLQLDAAANK